MFLTSGLKFHSPQRKIRQETVSENHGNQSSYFCQTTVNFDSIYAWTEMFILHLEQQFVSVVVERHVADPRNEYGNFLQNLVPHMLNFSINRLHKLSMSDIWS